MAVKNTTQVLIGGKIITLSGYESCLLYTSDAADD